MKAWELLSKPGAWIQDTCAVDRDGEDCTSTSHFACSWCTIGAINKCYPSLSERDAKMAIVRDAVASMGFDGIAKWNDSDNRTKNEVVSLLKELDV